MIYQNIILGIAALIGLLLFNKTKPKFLKGILAGLIVSIIIGFFKQQYLIDSSYLLFGLLALVFTIYCGVNKQLFSLLTGFFVVLSVFVDFMFFEYSIQVTWLMIIPILFYIRILFSWKIYQKELSILNILAAYELSELLALAGIGGSI